MEKFFTLTFSKEQVSALENNKEFLRLSRNQFFCYLNNFKNLGDSFFYNFLGNIYYKDANSGKIEVENFAKNTEHYLSKSKGHFSFVSFDAENFEAKVVTNVLGTVPVYLYKGKNLIAVSNSLFELKKYFKIETDKEGIFNYLIFNNYFLGRTVLKDVSQLQKGKIYKIRKNLGVEENNYIDFKLLANQKNKASNDVNFSKNNLIEITKSYNLENQTSSLALTNGFDSRLVLSFLLSEKINIQSFTFGNFGSNIHNRVTEICETVKITNNFYTVTEDFKANFDSFWQEIFVRSNGNFSIYRLLRVWASYKELEKADNLVFGFVGGEFIRGLIVDELMFSKPTIAIILGNKEEFILSCKQKLEKTFIKSDFFEDKFLNDYFDSIQGEFYKGFSIKERFLDLTLEVFGKHFGTDIFLNLQKGNVLTPYFDIDFISSVLSLKDNLLTLKPFSKSFKQKLIAHHFYCCLIKEFEPALIKVKLDRGYFPEDILEKRFLKVLFNYLKQRIAKEEIDTIPDYSMEKWFSEKMIGLLEGVKSELQDFADFKNANASLQKIEKGSNLTFQPFVQLVNIGLHLKK